MTSCSATDVAAHLIRTAGDFDMTNLVMQKLLYLCQAESMRTTGKALFEDDIVAWQSGPVVQDVYYAYAYRGASRLRHVCHVTHADRPDDMWVERPKELAPTSARIVDAVLDRWRGHSLWDITYHVMDPRRAWYKTYRPYEGNMRFGQMIRAELIAEDPAPDA